MKKDITNQEFARTNFEFRAASEKAGLSWPADLEKGKMAREPTTAQARKFRNKSGAAWKVFKGIAPDAPRHAVQNR